MIFSSNNTYYLKYESAPFPYKARFKHIELKEDGKVLIFFDINDKEISINSSEFLNGSVAVEELTTQVEKRITISAEQNSLDSNRLHRDSLTKSLSHESLREQEKRRLEELKEAGKAALELGIS
ncbi:hypothetical protein [Nostoc sp. FACHB-190]|uniref:hypothetical protein n=1 Tax=Nostoc sp. FACHB-190 TaxID=2692838 RepID=UPI001684DF24|nr:hypothetical protein [Nostoc sp. FACHB-190]MBD2303623.1 hypothetical protein [Nostoc sp. FACHB-190]